MKTNIKKGLLAFGILWVVLLFALFVVSQMNRPEEIPKHTNPATETETAQPQTPSYEVSAKQLATDYEANEVKADIKYKGQFFIVTGTIKRIDKSFTDKVYIVLDDGRWLGGIYCNFSKDEESSVARLSKGQYVKVGGEVRGKSVGSVSLDRCRLQ